MTETDFLSRTRTSYDTIADYYAEWIEGELAGRPGDRAVLAWFAELVRGDDLGPVADIGCGPGRISAHLHGLGVRVFGVDLSPAMIEVARRTYPDLRFDVGSMTSLELADGSLGGIVAWYSIIHVPDDALPRVFAEFERVLAPGGYLQLAFQVGDEPLHRDEAAGFDISLDFHRRQPDRVAALLTEAGFELRAHLLRERETYGEFEEKTPQAFLLARKRSA
ncbi:methyltransferase family protein [Prauserella shujinwangii]|uniref:Methyltransferase family protein n=1 Tax=Prauserella shujinwangii TaxID=1453103 RepID=A0A2T0LUR5_9PSEU|nr:class I SAM-dependent methyltransferase [Prauserella shujinwangii]PRX47575.1 methyltransferase family protein [Prauserella shujinwangii]